MKKTRTILSWSSGKDSAWALHTLRRDPAVEVVGLLTTVNREADRVAMHAVRRLLLEQQAEALGLPLTVAELPWPCTNDDYEAVMAEVVNQALAEGVEAFAFGDLFLEDIRRYREERLEGTGLQILFPLWGKETGHLAATMVASGLQARITCVDPAQLPAAFVGRSFDESFLGDLPEGVDPCGENGEFHTFVHDGPGFLRPIPIIPGEIVERGGFVYADLLPDA